MFLIHFQFCIFLTGITHTDPADPLFEVNLAHAHSKSLTSNSSWTKSGFAMGSILPETHLW